MKLFAAVLGLVLAGCSPADWAPSLVGSSVSLTLEDGRTYCSGTAVSATEVLTAAHCRAYQTILVKTEFGELLPATVVWEMPEKDLMLLTVPGANFTPAAIGDSASVRRGDLVYSVGNPHGELVFSFAVGYVGYVNRILKDLPNGVFFQLYMESRGGHSGGGVFNERGQLIAVVVRSDMKGITMAVPVDLADLLPHDEVLNAYP